MNIGIVGLPNVGKSTLFQALTKKQVDTSNYPFATIDPNVGVVAVPDERLAKLTDLSHSKKTIPASIEFVDIAGLVKGAAAGEGLGNTFLSHIREVDAICEVVRAFKNDDIHHVSGRIDPADDMETIHAELVLADLATAEKTVARLSREAKANDPKAKRQLAAAEHIRKLLAAGNLAVSYKPEHTDEQEILREMHLLTAKPFIFLFNVEDIEKPPPLDVKHGLAINIKMEAEISEMEEAAGELRMLSRLDVLIKKAYEAVGLITFLTTGEDETRAWAIPRDSTAPQAGAAIHSDFEEKFIKAEVIHYENLIHAGSYARAREQGLLQTKGKDYIVQDGDVIEFKI